MTIIIPIALVWVFVALATISLVLDIVKFVLQWRIKKLEEKISKYQNT